MTEQTHIYGLLCPLENKIRYVGKSDNPSTRLRQHLKAEDRTAKAAWITGLRGRGLKPKLVILQTVAVDGWREAERWWIDNLRVRGLSLTNAAPAPVGEALRVLRDDAMLSQRELASEAGISPATVLKIEKGEVETPHPSTMRKLAAALGVPPRDLRED